jgi:hypothetical protein
MLSSLLKDRIAVAEVPLAVGQRNASSTLATVLADVDVAPTQRMKSPVAHLLPNPPRPVGPGGIPFRDSINPDVASDRLEDRA